MELSNERSMKKRKKVEEKAKAVEEQDVADMCTISEYTFDHDGRATCVRISEVMGEEYGLYVWPCSIPLAEYIWQNQHRFSGVRILELGAGTALPGIVAAKAGSHVTLTDHVNEHKVFENLRRTCQLNDVECKIQSLTWGEWDEETCALQHQFDFVLGADVLYETEGFDDLFATVSFLLEGTPGAVFITTYQHRSGHRSIEYLLAKWGLHCKVLMDVRDFVPDSKLSSLPADIQLVEVVVTDNKI